MLADSIISGSGFPFGRLDPDIHLPSTVKLEIIGFIAEELPRWRDHADRPPADAETKLTEYLCDHLNSAVYYSDVWSHIQFQTETGDETRGDRKIDLSDNLATKISTFKSEHRREGGLDGCELRHLWIRMS